MRSSRDEEATAKCGSDGEQGRRAGSMCYIIGQEQTPLAEVREEATARTHDISSLKLLDLFDITGHC
jgi:hypothetical protein